MAGYEFSDDERNTGFTSKPNITCYKCLPGELSPTGIFFMKIRGAGRTSTATASIERRMGLARKNAKWKMGGIEKDIIKEYYLGIK